jgi:hypothetical protein
MYLFFLCFQNFYAFLELQDVQSAFFDFFEEQSGQLAKVNGLLFHFNGRGDVGQVAVGVEVVSQIVEWHQFIARNENIVGDV